MAYTTIDQIADKSLAGILGFPTIDTPIYYPIMLFVIFTVFTLYTYFKEVGRLGSGNFISSLAVAGFVTTVLAFIMSLIPIISVNVVVICLAITVVFVVIYMLTDK